MKPLAEVALVRRDGVVVASLVGEVDLSNVSEIRRALLEGVTQETECLVVDLSDTSYLDSTGVRMLFDLAVRLQARRQQLRLVVPNATIVRRVLVLTKLDQSVQFDLSVTDAVAACA